jgi:hypothetical protein
MLLPVSLVLLGLMLLAATFGAVPAAVLLGTRAWALLRLSPPTPPAAAVWGMLILSLLAELLHFIPLLGDLLVIALLLTALGAALLTRFGAQSYIPDTERGTLTQAEG